MILIDQNLNFEVRGRVKVRSTRHPKLGSQQLGFHDLLCWALVINVVIIAQHITRN